MVDQGGATMPPPHEPPAAEEPAAAADMQATGLGLLELPTELVDQILRKLSIGPRLALAGACKPLDEAVAQSPVWRVLSFAHWPRSGPKLTDKGLARLLTKIDARTNLVSLNLQNCTGWLDGSGLKPLEGALQLTQLDLRTGHPFGVITRHMVNFLPFAQMTRLRAPSRAGFDNLYDLGCSYAYKHAADEKREPAATPSRCAFCTVAICSNCVQDKRDGLKVLCTGCGLKACRTCRKLKPLPKCDGCEGLICHSCCLGPEDEETNLCPMCYAEEEEGSYGSEDYGSEDYLDY